MIYLLRPHGHLLYPQNACMIHIAKVIIFSTLCCGQKFDGMVPCAGRQARRQMDGANPMMWPFIALSYVHQHNIPGAWDIAFTALDNIEVLKVGQNQKKKLLLELSPSASSLLPSQLFFFCFCRCIFLIFIRVACCALFFF